jgi:AraC-like DNA-binding protein
MAPDVRPGDLCAGIATIPSIIGRMAYLSAARNPYTGRYEHESLADLHIEEFRLWLSLSCEAQVQDVRALLSTQRDCLRFAQNCLKPEYCQVLAPDSATGAQKRLFTCDLAIALATLRSAGYPPLMMYYPTLDRRVGCALRVIEVGRENVTLRALARQFGTSERHLGRLFKQQVGVTFHDCLRSRRMRHASELLTTSTMAVKQIAGATGYSDTSNFVRDFHIFFGHTPKEHRRKCIMPEMVSAFDNNYPAQFG